MSTVALPRLTSDCAGQDAPKAQLGTNAVQPTGERGSVDRIAAVRRIGMHGCELRAMTDFFRVGRFIDLEFASGFRLTAIVRWVDNGAAGVDFARALPTERVTEQVGSKQAVRIRPA